MTEEQLEYEAGVDAETGQPEISEDAEGFEDEYPGYDTAYDGVDDEADDGEPMEDAPLEGS